MLKFLRALAFAGVVSGLALSVPASAGPKDKPKGDHPERHCKPEKQQCGSSGTDAMNGYNWDEPDYGDNPDGDHPERKCAPERQWCPPED